MTSLPHRLDRSIVIQASRETVFRFFTDDPRWAAWWGSGSTIDARPGGRVRICFPGAVEASGEVLDVLPPERLVFTFGFASGKPIPVGGSRVTIRLETEGTGTRLNLYHEFSDATARDEHIQGWRYQLSLFGNVVADEVNAGASGIVDAWFDAWLEPNTAVRETTLARIATRDVRFRDRYGLIDGVDDLVSHITAVQRFMPGIRMHRRGEIRHCQGTVLAEWVAVSDQGEERSTGTNVFVFNGHGLIESVTGLAALRRA